MKAIVKSWGMEIEVTLEIALYAENKNLAIQMWCEIGPYAILTVNLSRKCKPNCAFVDTNNCPWAENFIEKYKLGMPTGDMEMSGFCVYPEYEFDLAEIAKYSEQE